MIFNVFIAVILIFCYAVSYVKSATDYKNYKVRSIDYISIPNEIVNDNEVNEIMDKYFKDSKFRFCISTLITLIIIPLSSELFMAIVFTIFAVWLGFELRNNMREIPNERFYKRNKYILGGMFYYDKDSKKTFITEKNSPNFIPNLATVGGKITGVIIGASMIFVVLLPIGLFASALTDVSVVLKEDKITFKYLVYTESVELKNIKSYSLLDKKPNLKMRTNGLAIDDKKIGYFKVEGYSKSKVYFEGDGLPVLYVKTDDKNFFVNSSDRVDVEELYNELKKLDKLD